VSFVISVPVVFTDGVVVTISELDTMAGNTVNVIVVVEHGGDKILQSVYVALVVPVKPVAGAKVY
jgi:hypothetical protein